MLGKSLTTFRISFMSVCNCLKESIYEPFRYDAKWWEVVGILAARFFPMLIKKSLKFSSIALGSVVTCPFTLNCKSMFAGLCLFSSRFRVSHNCFEFPAQDFNFCE